MSNDDSIVAVEVLETENGEKLVLDSPYDAKPFINALPWKKLEDEVEEHGSFRAKLEDFDVDEAAIQAAEEFDFDDEFSAHPTWDATALGEDDGAWLIDAGSWDEARDFFEFCGFEVEVSAEVAL